MMDNEDDNYSPSPAVWIFAIAVPLMLIQGKEPVWFPLIGISALCWCVIFVWAWKKKLKRYHKLWQKLKTKWWHGG